MGGLCGYMIGMDESRAEPRQVTRAADPVPGLVFPPLETHLANISLSSCSDTNWPRLATNSVEQGALAASGGLGG